jgi:arylsulfatase A
MRLLLSLTGLLIISLGACAAQIAKPNIVYILADDLGLGNVSCYGADTFKTPRIDAMAKGGTRFTYNYAAPLCGPSRCELLTGRYAFHTGMTGNDSGSLVKPQNEVMIPRMLKPAGYVSAQAGKWGQLPLQPGDFGFDEYLRFQGSGVYWKGDHAGQNKDVPTPETIYVVNGKQKKLKAKEYMPDVVEAFALDFIRRHKDQPFFLYYPISEVHTPMRRTPDGAPDSKDFFADNITYMDKLVGHMLDELDKLKLREKTVVFFVGDNGTAKGDSDRSTINGKHIFGHKGELNEGGSRVPLIVNWPGVTSAGVVNNDLTDFSDFYPTIAELTGAKLPEGLPIDGKSFAPQIRGEKGHPRDWAFVELGNKWYVRDARYKLTKDGELLDLQNAPFEEKPVTNEDADAKAAHQRLQAVLDKLNPAGGKQDTGDGSGRHARKAKKQAKKAQKNSNQ